MDQPIRAADLVTESLPPADGAWATRSNTQHGSSGPADSSGVNGAFDPNDPNGPDYQDDPDSGDPNDPDDEDLDLLAAGNRMPSKLTVVLLAAILAGVAFVGGTIVQKHYGTSTTSAAGTGRGTGSAGFPRAGGYGSFGGTGSFGGAGSFGGGTGAGTGAGGGAGGGAGTGAAAAADSPAVVGQVVKVSGTTITVKNFAGKTFTVKVPAGTTITVSSSVSLTGLKAGTAVSVVGKTAADGTVTASSVTARK